MTHSTHSNPASPNGQVLSSLKAVVAAVGVLLDTIGVDAAATSIQITAIHPDESRGELARNTLDELLATADRAIAAAEGRS